MRIVCQPFEDLLPVFIWNTSIQTTHHFQPCQFFLTHVYLLDSLKLSLCCTRTIVSFILVFVQSTIFSMISLSKYKWKVCFQFCLLWYLGQDNLFYPKWYRIFAIYQWLLDALSATKFSLCFCLSLDQDNHKVIPKHHLYLYIWFLCNCFHLIHCQCRERFDCEWVAFSARIFVADLYYLQVLQISNHSSLGIESISSSSPHSHRDYH